MEFHLIRNGKQEGPFSVEELSQQGITPESEVWAPGMADWQQAGDIPELTAVLQRAEFEASQQAARAAENQPTMGQPYEPATPPSYNAPQVPPRYPVEAETKKRGCTPRPSVGVWRACAALRRRKRRCCLPLSGKNRARRRKIRKFVNTS